MMAKKYVRDIFREVKDIADYAAYLDKLADALDTYPMLDENVKKFTDTLMPAGVLRGAATTLKEYGKMLDATLGEASIEWPPVKGI